MDLLCNHLKGFCDVDLFCVYHLNILLFFLVDYLMLSYFDIVGFDIVDFDIVDFVDCKIEAIIFIVVNFYFILLEIVN